MSKLLSKMGMLLAYDWSQVGNGTEYLWLGDLFNVLNPILYAIMAVVGAAGAIYAIILGVNLAVKVAKHYFKWSGSKGVTKAGVPFFISRPGLVNGGGAIFNHINPGVAAS